MTTTTNERPTATPIRVLFVDPDREALERILPLLEAESSIDATAFPDAERALEFLETRPVDCVVSEVTLPDSDGIEFFDAVRSRNPAIPFVFFTETPLEDCPGGADRDGITDYVRKGDAEQRSRWLGTRIATVTAAGTDDTDTRGMESAPGPCSGGSCVLDEELRILEASETFARVHGFEPGELRGEPWSVVHADADIDRRREDILSAVETAGRWCEEATGLRTDGSTVPCEYALFGLGPDRYLYVVTDLSGRDRSLDPFDTAIRTVCQRRRPPDGLDRLLEAATSRLADILEVDRVGVFEHRSARGTYTCRSSAGWDDEDGPPDLPERILDPDPFTVPSVEHLEFDSDTEPAGSALEADYGVVSGLVVPIIVSSGVWGFVGCFSTTTGSYREIDETIVRTVGSTLTTAIDCRRRGTDLETIDDLVGSIFDGDTKRDVCELVVDALEGRPDLSFLATYLFDERDDVLRLATRTGEGNGTGIPTRIDGNVADLVWNAFLDHEPTLVAELSPRPSTPVTDPSLARGVVVPLGHHGAFVAGTTDPARTMGATLETATTLATLVRSGLDRIDGERRLEEQTKTIRERTETVERLTELGDLVRNVDRAIVDAQSRRNLEDAVCEHVLEYDPIVFVWIGEYDDVTEEITPRAWAGAEKSYLSAISVDLAEPVDEQEPMAVAVDRGEPYYSLRLMDEIPPDPWQREALKRGYRSVLSIPIAYREFRYGGLTMYSDRPTVFDSTASRTFVDIGDRLGHAFNAFERRNALLDSSGVVELEFRVRDERIPFIQWSREIGGRFECETIISRPDGTMRGFFTIEGTEPERVLELAERSSAVGETTLITEREEASLFQCTLTEDSVGAQLLEYGAVPTMMTASGDEGRIVVELSEDANVREFVTVVQSMYPDSELIRRTHLDRPPQTRYEFKTEVEEELTDRQLEALRTAYFSGYFETPRENSGKEIASLLDIAQPTLNHHLRTAQRKLFRMLFTEDRPDRCRSTDSE
ncbi:bacterio-opsin activator domain-containing protein [Natrialbaceae archaeon A-gly3]